MVDCTLLLLERLECCVVDVDRSVIGECTLLILVNSHNNVIISRAPMYCLKL